MAELSRYRSNQIVKAGVIMGFRGPSDYKYTLFLLPLLEDGGHGEQVEQEVGYEWFRSQHDFLRNHKQPIGVGKEFGDYFVEDEAGSFSIIKREIFEKTHRFLDKKPVFNFDGEAEFSILPYAGKNHIFIIFGMSVLNLAIDKEQAKDLANRLLNMAEELE